MCSCPLGFWTSTVANIPFVVTNSDVTPLVAQIRWSSLWSPHRQHSLLSSTNAFPGYIHSLSLDGDTSQPLLFKVVTGRWEQIRWSIGAHVANVCGTKLVRVLVLNGQCSRGSYSSPCSISCAMIHSPASP